MWRKEKHFDVVFIINGSHQNSYLFMHGWAVYKGVKFNTIVNYC
jgi:hypothetical protein